MKPSDRISITIDVTGIPVYEEGRVIRYTSLRSMTGAELAGAIASTTREIQRLVRCREAMQDAFDFGKTPEEVKALRQWQQDNPELAARSFGWERIEDFAERCDKSDTGFYNRIKGVKGSIVKAREYDLKRLLGNTWARYPDRCELWADHFQFATNWKEALELGRKELAREEAERWKGV